MLTMNRNSIFGPDTVEIEIDPVVWPHVLAAHRILTSGISPIAHLTPEEIAGLFLSFGIDLWKAGKFTPDQIEAAWNELYGPQTKDALKNNALEASVAVIEECKRHVHDSLTAKCGPHEWGAYGEERRIDAALALASEALSKTTA
jgi:hypothetical protein